MIDASPSILSIYDIDENTTNTFSKNQQNQIRVAQSGKEIIDKEGIKQFVNSLEYPFAFLDYETYPSAIPIFDGYSPYKQIPFQFSLHIREHKGDALIHQEFLHTKEDCPDSAFIEYLIEVLPKKGSVFVWNKSFEKGINVGLAERNQKYKNDLDKINERLVDLEVPFKGEHAVYIHPHFKGKSSIKYVLPALVPELSYKELEIQEGGTASSTWFDIVHGDNKNNQSYKDQKTKALKEYCCLDTLAMVKIFDVLESKI